MQKTEMMELLQLAADGLKKEGGDKALQASIARAIEASDERKFRPVTKYVVSYKVKDFELDGGIPIATRRATVKDFNKEMKGICDLRLPAKDVAEHMKEYMKAKKIDTPAGVAILAECLSIYTGQAKS